MAYRYRSVGAQPLEEGFPTHIAQLLIAFFEGRINSPVLFWLELVDFIFAIDNQFESNGLDTTS